jgi:hypothetical protein
MRHLVRLVMFFEFPSVGAHCVQNLNLAIFIVIGRT